MNYLVWSLNMKKVMVLLAFCLGLNVPSQASNVDPINGSFGEERGVLEVLGIEKSKSRSPRKSIYRFSARVLVGGNDCLAKGVRLKFRRFFEDGVDYFWIRKEFSPDLRDRFCTKEFKPVYKYFTQRIAAEKLVLVNVLNMGKVDADTLLDILAEESGTQRDIEL
tara:strand:- start:897 stop:1391 length:495 start_codon:yes stop_codon:yes gene_type:complete